MGEFEGDRLLIVNSGAGGVDDALLSRLQQEFPEHRLVNFPPEAGFAEKLRQGSIVIACGGDGTIAEVARALAGTGHAFGILAMGTFNNFARALKLPTDIEEAIRVVKTGRPRPVTLGRINGVEFLEAAAVGFFGDSIALGEAAKDLHYGELLQRVRDTALSRAFRFRVTGDVTLAGSAVSLIVANTPSIGALVPVGESTPEEPYLELLITRGRSRLALVTGFLGALIRRRPPARVEAHPVRRIEITTEPAMSVHADASEAGETPARIEAWPGGLRVILP